MRVSHGQVSRQAWWPLPPALQARSIKESILTSSRLLIFKQSKRLRTIAFVVNKKMKVLILLSLAAVACASLYKHAVVVDHDLDHYEDIPVKTYHSLPVQSLSYHPALLSHHYPVKKVVVHYPSGLYHGPHGLGIYNPKLHDKLEQDYYRG